MKLTYTVTEQEFRQGLALYFKGRKIDQWGILVTTGLIFAFVGLIGWFSLDGVWVRALLIGIFALLYARTVALVLTPKGRAKAFLDDQRKHRLLSAGVFGPRVLEAREAQLVVTMGGQEYALAWQALREVREAEGYVLLLRDGGELFTPIPPSAFLDPAWRATLVAELRRCIETPAPVQPTPVAEYAERVITFPAWTDEELVDDLVAGDWITLRPFFIGMPLLLLVGAVGTPLLTYAGVTILSSGLAGLLPLMLLAALLGMACSIAALTGLIMTVFLLVGILPWVRKRRRKLLAGGSMRPWLSGEQRMAFTADGIQVDRDGSAEVVPWTIFLRACAMKKGGVLLCYRGFRLAPIPPAAFRSEEERTELLEYLKTKGVKKSVQRGRAGA